ncbi:MAG: hypothetical protein EOS24_33660 [Mesorhizobium sp.]|uniref:HI1506-related protein n=2 Tax=Mesorhizobium sp. TaxID=1871066 RepID=UPI000FE7DAF8|nr:HI1506-related protein [Mesorhizobium sp.]RWE51087.1 MAG: hypothetical protein EOS24_33660 [Mesorhizobium sp.]
MAKAPRASIQRNSKPANSEAAEPVIADQHVAETASPASDVTLVVAPAAPSLGAATGIISSITVESEGQGGAGNAAGSAEPSTLDEFQAKFPRLSAAIEAWKATSYEPPVGLRIRSKIEGFRRAGVAHSKAPVEHPLDRWPQPEQLEALFSEPNLTIELF